MLQTAAATRISAPGSTQLKTITKALSVVDDSEEVFIAESDDTNCLN
jgi:hypothetical protein